jgi:hypothetical protein
MCRISIDRASRSHYAPGSILGGGDGIKGRLGRESVAEGRLDAHALAEAETLFPRASPGASG